MMVSLSFSCSIAFLALWQSPGIYPVFHFPLVLLLFVGTAKSTN